MDGLRLRKMTQVILHVLSVILHFLCFLLRPIYALIYLRKPSSIPPIKNPLLKLSATMLAKKIRTGELSSQTVVEAYIERIVEVNPFINAVIEDRFEAAVNDAKICDARLKNGEVNVSKLEEEKPLYGVPITIKESCSLKGLSYTGGSLLRRGVKATKDGASVELLKNAGAIPLLVSNTPEMCSGFTSSNYLHGTTRNPYDRRYTTGGSSSGEAALISSGASVLGFGSDFLGSIRIPALFTGVFGHKSTPGIAPNNGHLPATDNSIFQKLLVLGPLARHVDDLYLAMKVLSSKCEKSLHLDEPVDISNLQVFYVDHFKSYCGILSTTPEIKQKIQEATQHLSKQGARVEKLPQDINSMLSRMLPMIIALLGHIEMPNLLVEKKNSILEFIKSIVGLSQHTSVAAFGQTLVDVKGYMSSSDLKYCLNIGEELRQKLNNVLKGNKVLICPTFSHEASISQLVFFEIDVNVYCSLANMCYLPATHVPMGLKRNGLPTGFQVISASYQDHICLAVAKELEKAFGGWIPPS